MIKKTDNINMRVSAQMSKTLADAYGNKTKGATRAVRSWMILRKATMADLTEFFTPDELSMIRSAFYGLAFCEETAISKHALAITVELAWRRRDENRDLDEIMQKIDEITPAEALFLTEWACMPVAVD